MTINGSNSPAWLFSFVDLAFLLLIAMTQLVAEPGPEFGEIAVPRLRASDASALPAGATQRWQLRVHAADGSPSAPFELALSGTAAQEESSPGLVRDELREELRRLRAAAVAKPILAPHADSRSQDLLDAIAALEESWPSHRRVAVLRSFEGS